MKFKAIFSKTQLDIIYSKIAKYLPLAGGAVTGETTFEAPVVVQSGLTADAITTTELQVDSASAKYVTLTPETPSNVDSGSIFADSTNNNALSFKKSNGDIVVIVS